MTPVSALALAGAVTDLHRAGRLVTDYPQVRPLLTGLSEAGLAAAGQLLSRLDPDQVLAAHPDTVTVRVAITGHGTLAPLIPPLTAQLARHGLLLRPHLGAFDGYVFELGDPASALYVSRPDLVTCVLDPMLVFDEVPSPWGPADVAKVLAEKLTLLERLVDGFARTCAATLVLNTVPLPHHWAAQLVDQRSRARLGALWREANARLLRLAEDYASVVVLDLDPLLAEGVPAVDPRMDVYAKAHLSPQLLARYAREVGHLAANLAGQGRKCLALDLDGTLWGGVLGEDGPDGIELAGTRRGEAFGAFQRVVKQLGAQGVLLAAVSKNDIEPVRSVLREQPDMLLREDDFVRVSANWRPKHENLAELAADLNLAPEALVFADDSAYECGSVRSELPAVAVVHLDGDPALHVANLLRDGWFDVRELTTEDRDRVSRYREELARKDFLQTFDSLEQYLRELRVVVRLGRARDGELARVSQLSLRTNQFNLTGERLSPAEVAALAADQDALLLTVHTEDRFGANGLVGAVVTHRAADVLHIDNFLLSCRVFSRGIEQACLSTVLRHARDRGVSAVTADYRHTSRNAVVREFYPSYGFQLVRDDGATRTYRHDLGGIVSVPEHVRLHADLGGTTL